MNFVFYILFYINYCNCDTIEDDIKSQIGYSEISLIHDLIDKDNDGNMDPDESKTFINDEYQMNKELQYKTLMKNPDEYSGFLHKYDYYITKNEFWQYWFNNTAYRWTNDDIIVWLVDIVKLGDYTNIFIENNITGALIPKLAVNKTFIIKELGINDINHVKRIKIVSLGTILFEDHKKNNNIYTYILITCLLVCICLCSILYLRYYNSKQHLKLLFDKLTELKRSESELKILQQQLEIVESEKEFAIKQGIKSQINLLKQNSDSKSETQEIKKIELQIYLQICHEVEQNMINQIKDKLTKKLQNTKRECEKYKRRNNSFLKGWRLLHGSQINDTFESLTKIKKMFNQHKIMIAENAIRWSRIEDLCGYQIVQNEGIDYLKNYYNNNFVHSSGRKMFVIGQD
ncbi:hypothetical protein A3Q56_03679 [Intoshia linei]|uniref:SAM domain-containing protein n=1 Tax=Intoshia linei TaxID=1819745 RepID=A0A177B2R9_9BILA|nr:hypothetical protein A3Q56_03679 [Intoshia linei]